VTIDTVYPRWAFVNPSTPSVTGQNFKNIWINVSNIDANPGIIKLIMQNASGQNITYSNLGADSFFMNYTVINDGVYYMWTEVNDTAGHVNNSIDSGAEGIIGVLVDTVIPQANFGTNSTMNGTQLADSINIEVTTPVDIWNNTNITIFLYNSTYDLVGSKFCDYVELCSQNFTSLGYGTYYTNGTVIDGGNNANSTDTRVINITAMIFNSHTANLNSISGSLESFTFNVSAGNYPSLPYVVYNGVSHLSSITDTGGSNYIITSSFNVPVVSSPTNFSYYLNVTDSLGNNANSPSYNQTVYNLGIDNCSSYPNLIFNFTLVDEDTQIPLNGPVQNTSVNLAIDIYDILSNTVIGSINLSYSGDANPQFCVGNNLTNNTYYVKGIVEYQASSYIHEFYYLQNYTITSIPFNVYLYDLLISRSQEFLVTYKDSNFMLAKDVLVYVTRRYIPENQFKTVEVAKTDTNGQALIHLVLGDVIYTLVFVDSNNNVMSIFENYVPFCDNIALGQCSINTNAFYQTTDLTDFSNIGGITARQSFNATDRTIRTTFTSLSGVSTVNQTVVKFDRFGNNTICSSQLISPSGSINCNIPVTYGDVSLLTRLYSNGVLVSENQYSITPSPTATYGLEGTMFAILIIITLVMVFITSLTGIIFAFIIGIIIAGVLGLLVIGSVFGLGSIVIWLIISGGILIWKISNRGEAR
jgi:hypothetical protein